MNERVLLSVTSLLSLLLLSIHVCDDIARGFDKWSPPSLIGVLVLGILLYGTLVWPERRAGQVITLLVGILAAGMPVIHRNAGAVAKASGGLFFIWTLFALGALGTVTVILSARRLGRR
jgi:hypothetical protein